MSDIRIHYVQISGIRAVKNKTRQYREQFVELSALAVFVAIAECGTLTAAARKIGLTQSSISQVLKQTEMLLGVPLVDRTTRPLRLTLAGLRFKAHADNMLREARKISTLVHQDTQSSLPKISMGLIDSCASTIGPHIVRQLHNRAEHLTLWSGVNPALREALFNRELDLVITADSPEPEVGLERHELFRDPFILILPANYAELGDDGLRGLASRLPLIRYSRRSLIGVQVDIHLRRLGLEPADRYEFDTSDALFSMVSAGFGWGLTTSVCLLQARHALGQSKVVPLPGPGLSRQVSLIARKSEHENIPRQVANMCRDIFRTTLLPEMRLLLPWVRESAYNAVSESSVS